jgi:hypothetical protein
LAGKTTGFTSSLEKNKTTSAEEVVKDPSGALCRVILLISVENKTFISGSFYR